MEKSSENANIARPCLYIHFFVQYNFVDSFSISFAVSGGFWNEKSAKNSMGRLPIAWSHEIGTWSACFEICSFLTFSETVGTTNGFHSLHFLFILNYTSLSVLSQIIQVKTDNFLKRVLHILQGKRTHFIRRNRVLQPFAILTHLTCLHRYLGSFDVELKEVFIDCFDVWFFSDPIS